MFAPCGLTPATGCSPTFFGAYDLCNRPRWLCRASSFTNTSTRNAAQLSIQASMSRRVSGCRNTPVAPTQRTRQYNATRTHGNAQVHCRDSHANAGAPCGHTRTRMHAVAPAARALRSCVRRRMAWQLQLSISTMLAMAPILLTTRIQASQRQCESALRMRYAFGCACVRLLSHLHLRSIAVCMRHGCD